MRVSSFFVIVATLIIPTVANADIAPAPGYVERCTVDKQQQPGETCTKCAASHKDYYGCVKRHAADGACRKCKSHGASVWSEVWCIPNDRLADANASASDASSDASTDAPAPDAEAGSPWDGTTVNACPGTNGDHGIKLSTDGTEASSDPLADEGESSPGAPKAGSGGCTITPGQTLGPWLLALGVPLLLRRRKTK
jgi:hypothetical protein